MEYIVGWYFTGNNVMANLLGELVKKADTHQKEEF